jgi:hypothetical protein
MPHIKKLMRTEPPKGYATLSEYADAWYTMFGNAKIFNVEGSQIYRDAEELECSFRQKLVEAAARHNIPISEEDDLVVSDM